MARLPIQTSNQALPRSMNQQFASAQTFSGGAAGLADVGEALSQYAEIEQRVINDAEVSNATAIAGGVLATVRAEAKRQPIKDIDGFYTDQTERAYSDLTANMNPAVKREFDKAWGRLSIATKTEVNIDRRARLTSEAKAGFENDRLGAQKAIAAAGYDTATAVEIEQNLIGQVERLQQLGVYTAEDAQQIIADVRSENAAIGVRELMMVDPVAARDALEDDEQFNSLDAETRIQMLERAQSKVDTLERANVARQEKLNAEARRQLSEAQEYRSAELTAQIIDDPLSMTLADIEEEANSGRISGTQASTLYKLVTAEQEDARLDPYTYTGLIDDAYDLANVTDPVALRRETAALRERAANAYAAGVIEKADFNSLKSLLDSVGSEAFTGVKSGRDYIKSVFGITEGTFLSGIDGDATSAEMQNALRQYDIRVNSAMAEGRPFNPMDIANGIVDRTSKAALSTQSVLTPQFGLKDDSGQYKAVGEYTVGDVFNVLEKTVAEFRDGTISRQVFEEERRNLMVIKRGAEIRARAANVPNGAEEQF